MGKKYDWEQIKNDYVQAPTEADRPTLDELAARYGCAAPYLREKASKEGWRVQSERYLETVAQKRQEQKSEALAGDLAEWDVKCFNAAQAGMAHIYARMQAAHEDMKKGEPPLSFRSIEDMARSLERLQKIGRIALGEKDDSKLSIKIDYSKLTDDQLERIAAGENPRDVIS